MAIRFYDEGSGYALKGRRRVAAWIRECARNEGFAVGDLAFVFCTPERHIEMNRTYLGHDYPTDVITFDYSDHAAGAIAGDIFIDPATVARNAADYGTAPGREMLRVMVHGVLHLCGYGDKTPAEQTAMRAKEDECLVIYDATAD